MESSLPGRVGTAKMWVLLLLAVLLQPGSPAPPQLCHATDPRPYLLAATKTGYTPLLDDALPAAPLPGRAARRSRLSAAASAKQKLSTRFQPQRKPQHRSLAATASSVKRAKTFSLGGPGAAPVQPGYKTLPKQASSRSLGSTSTDSSQGSQSAASSRKSSNSSNISASSAASASTNEISQTALEEIEAFEKFIENYFESCDNNNKPMDKLVKQVGSRDKQKVSATSLLSEVLELSI